MRILVGGNRVSLMTAGRVKESVRCGVNPYPTSPRIDACEPNLLLRPKMPKSKLNSPFEFVGVASPNTGPWPAALPYKGIAKIASRTNARLIFFFSV